MLLFSFREEINAVSWEFFKTFFHHKTSICQKENSFIGLNKLWKCFDQKWGKTTLSHCADSWIHTSPWPSLQKKYAPGGSWGTYWTATQIPHWPYWCTFTRLSFKQHGVQEQKSGEQHWVSPVSDQMNKTLWEGIGSPSLPFLFACSLLNWEETLNGINLVPLQNRWGWERVKGLDCIPVLKKNNSEILQAC